MAFYKGPSGWNGVMPVSQYRCLWRHAAAYRSAEWIEAPRHRMRIVTIALGTL